MALVHADYLGNEYVSTIKKSRYIMYGATHFRYEEIRLNAQITAMIVLLLALAIHGVIFLKFGAKLGWLWAIYFVYNLPYAIHASIYGAITYGEASLKYLRGEIEIGDVIFNEHTLGAMVFLSIFGPLCFTYDIMMKKRNRENYELSETRDDVYMKFTAGGG